MYPPVWIVRGVRGVAFVSQITMLTALFPVTQGP